MDPYNFPHDPNRYPTDCTEIHFPTSPIHQAFDNLASQVEAYTFNTLKPAHMKDKQPGKGIPKIKLQVSFLVRSLGTRLEGS